MFNDSYFDGNQYAVSIDMSIYTDVFLEPFVLEVTKADYGLYQYQKSYNLYQYTDNGLLGLFTEPSQVYSNVRNGIGVVCSQSLPVTFSINLGT